MAELDISLATIQDVTEYMGKRIGNFATVLGWEDFSTSDSPLYEAGVDAVLALGFTDVADVSDYQALRASAEYFAWLEVVNQVGSFYKFQADGATYSREQLQGQALKNLQKAYDKALAKGVDVDETEADEIVVLGIEWNDF